MTYSAACKNRKEAQDVSEFRFLLKTPAVGAFKLPGNARLAFKGASVPAAGTVLATIVSTVTRTIHSNGKDLYQILDRAERGSTVTPAAGITVLLDTGLSAFKPIGSA